MHLNMAQKMMTRPELSEKTADLIRAHWGAFCLGQIAADYQQLCDTMRRTTHFYKTPPEPGDYAAFERMLEQNPNMTEWDNLDPAEAVFIAGYGSHLYYDLDWFHNIVMAFVVGDWGDRKDRFVDHNTLLAHEDQQSLPVIESGTGEAILAVNAAGWLPFDPDYNLKAWQELVGHQLLPGAEIETLNIFAGRMDISAAELAQRVTSPEWMQEHIFAHVPRQLVDEVFERSLVDGIKLIEDYLRPLL